MLILTIVLSLLGALLGRWVQLHFDKILPKTVTEGADPRLTGILRLEFVIVGTVAVVLGSCGTVLGMARIFGQDAATMHRVMLPVGIAAGVAAAVYVRREVRAKERRRRSS
jgi:hypothetical protein